MFGGILDIHAGCGPIAWGEVPDSYVLVFLKATQGTRIVDQTFDLNLQGALGTKRLVIPYHVVSSEPAEMQISHFSRTAGLYASQAAMLVWEDPFGFGDLPPIEVIEAMVKSVETATRRLPVLRYALAPASSAIARCPWMRPSDHELPDDDWLFRAERLRGVVPGIKRGLIDHVWWNGSEDELAGFYRTGALPGAGGGAAAAADGGADADREVSA